MSREVSSVLKVRNIKFILGILIVVLIISGCPKRSEEQELQAKVKPFVDNGFKAFQEKNYKEAIKQWEQALKINPKLDYLYMNLGVCYYFTKKREKALELWKKYKELRPNDASVYNSIGGYYKDLGELYLAQNKFNEAKQQLTKAIKYFEQAGKLNPYYNLPYFNLGELYYKMKNYKKAIESFNQSLKISPKDVKSLVELAKTYRAMNDYPKALDTLRKAKLFVPSDPYTRFELGFQYLISKKYDLAKDEFQKLIEEFSDTPFGYYGMALLNLEQGKLKDIDNLINKAISKDKQNEVLYKGVIAKKLIKENKLDEAISIFKEILPKIPRIFDFQISDYYYQLGNALIKKGKTQEAAKYYHLANEIFPNNAHKEEIEKFLLENKKTT